MAKYYEDIKKIQQIAWANDDCILQDNLFDLQDKIAELALKIAESEEQTADLIKSFPWLYRAE